jgi:hypothetical protein
LAEEAPGARLLTVEPDSILPVAPGTPARERPKPDVHHALAAPSSQTVALTTPELADFAVCPRRFQLARLIGLPEPGKDPKPAHGEVYAACAVREGAKVERDRVYLVRASSHDVSATIRGTIDLWVERADASTEAVLLATDPGEVSPRTSVVSELALLAEAGRTDHRTGALTRGRDDAPVWCSKPERAALQATEKRILAWVAACAHARWTGAFTRAPLSTCHAIGCGYVSLCHPRALQAG